MIAGMRARLGFMMFLQYFIWGAWYVTLATWLTQTLHLSGQQIGLATGTTAAGAMIAPFFVGIVADKLFATEHVLAVLHLVGALCLFAASRQTSFGAIYALLLLFCLCYMPTLALTNSLAFRRMTSPGEEFGPIRVLGTAGWIAAGLLVGTLRLESTAHPLEIASAASLVMAFYSLTLPHTPPLAQGGRALANRRGFVEIVFPREALSVLRARPVAVFLLASLLICIPLQFYYALTNLFLNEVGVVNAAGKMTGGQMSELGCMLLIPWFFRRLGVKGMLAAGMGAWVLRYVFFAFGNASRHAWMLWFGILLHGICYDFFFVTGQIYIDRKSPASLRAATQGAVTFITYGVGMFTGSWLCGTLVEHFSHLSAATAGFVVTHDWRAIWLIAAFISIAVLVLFLITFFDNERQLAPTAERVQALPLETSL